MHGSRNAVLRYLRRDPLKHILHLKMLMHHGHLVETTHVVEGAAEGSLLLFPTTALSYDHHHYGEYALVAMPVADSPQLLGALLDHIPRAGVVFKVVQDADAALIEARFVGARVRVFLNFTAAEAAAFSPDPDVLFSTQLNVELIEAFGRNGYTPTELTRFFADGGQALSITEEGHPVAVGLLYRNFDHIWEIAALFTPPSARRKGYAARIVRTALHTLQQRGYTPRYVVDATNVPSIKLAEMVGLKRFLTVIHYAASGRSAMDAAPMYGTDNQG
jgi:GNAT superfamily N-acetyltransferase